MFQVEVLLLQVIRSAAEGNREGVLQKSIEMKFLTGFESKVKLSVFVGSVLTPGGVRVGTTACANLN